MHCPTFNAPFNSTTARSSAIAARVYEGKDKYWECSSCNYTSATSLQGSDVTSTNETHVGVPCWCEITAVFFDSPERDGDSTVQREDSLRRYIETQVRRVEEIRSKLDRAPQAKERFNLRNRSGGPRHRLWMGKNNVVTRELDHRDNNERILRQGRWHSYRANQVFSDLPPIRSQAPEGDKMRNGSSYPAQYAVDKNRIERRLQAEEMGLRQPTRKENLTAAILNAQVEVT